jgi:LysR family cys regulon transcriptional activator
VLNAFQNNRLSPKIAVSAVDTDVMKAYAAQGLGVAIMSKVAFDATADRPLRAIPVSHLFGKDTIYIGLRKYSHLRRRVMEFICLYAPKLTAAVVVAALNGRPLN